MSKVVLLVDDVTIVETPDSVTARNKSAFQIVSIEDRPSVNAPVTLTLTRWPWCTKLTLRSWRCTCILTLSVLNMYIYRPLLYNAANECRLLSTYTYVTALDPWTSTSVLGPSYRLLSTSALKELKCQHSGNADFRILLLLPGRPARWRKVFSRTYRNCQLWKSHLKGEECRSPPSYLSYSLSLVFFWRIICVFVGGWCLCLGDFWWYVGNKIHYVCNCSLLMVLCCLLPRSASLTYLSLCVHSAVIVAIIVMAIIYIIVRLLLPYYFPSD